MNRRRRPLAGLLTLAFALCLGGAAVESGARLALAPGDPAPELRGYDLDGARSRVDYAAHRFTLVNFWATWCAPCREEMPAIAGLHRELRESGLAVYGVLIEPKEAATAREFLDGLGVDYPILLPDRRVRSEWQPGMLPATYLIDERGAIVRRYVGATKEQVEGLTYDVRAALEGRPLGPLVIPQTPAASTSEDRPKKKTVR